MNDVNADAGVHEGDFGAGPGGDEGVIEAVAGEGEVGEAEGFAEDDGEAGDGGKRECFEEHDRLVEEAVVLGLAADDEAGHVLEEDEGDVEGFAEADELGSLVAGFGSERAGVEHGVAGEDADGSAADAGERGDQGAPEAGFEFEHSAVVDDSGDHAVHVVGALAAGGDEFGELRVGLGVVVTIELGRCLPAVVGEVGEERFEQGDRLVFGFGDLIDLAGTIEVDVDPAQVLQRDSLAGGDFNYSRTGHRHRRSAHLHHEIGERTVERRTSERLAEDRRRQWNTPPPPSHLQTGRDFAEALGAERVGQPRPARLAEVDVGHALRERLLVDPLHALAADDGGGAVQHRNVVAAGRRGPPLDGPPAADLAVARRPLPHIGMFGYREGADFAEAAVVEEAVEALADGEASASVLAGDSVVGAHALDDASAALVEVVANLLGGADGVGHYVDSRCFGQVRLTGSASPFLV